MSIYDAVRPHTMTSPERVATLAAETDRIVRDGVPGAFVECGVWAGGSMMAVALRLCELETTDRELYLYDTFTGMTAPDARDVTSFGVSAGRLMRMIPRAKAFSPLRHVKRNMETTKYPGRHIHYVVGPVEDTIPGHAPEQIALLRLDTDWYASTAHELEHLWPLVVPGGALIVDDYGYWRGARQAVDESNLGPLKWIDDTGVLIRKPSDDCLLDATHRNP